MNQSESWVETQLKPILNHFEKHRQIGIFGGNFNPVHMGHLLVADQVVQQLGLERVYLMPEAIPPHIDTKGTISSEHRLNMLELAITGNPRLGIELIELQSGGINYTFDTMKELRKMNPEVDYFFIIGADMVSYLPKWHRIGELVELVQFVGVRRLNYPEETNYPVTWVDMPKVDFSSTRIREWIAAGNSPDYLVPDLVAQYIQEKRLYLNENE